MIDWNDLKHFLAVAETGSTLAAGHRLGVSQTTVSRRISALEAGLGLLLFDRRQSGYALTDVGRSVLEQATSAGGAMKRFCEAAASLQREISGTVRLTTLDIYAITILVPILRDLRQAYPAIMVELDTSVEARDLAAGAADIALRLSKSPKGSGLVGRRIAPQPWTIYCSLEYASKHRKPLTTDDLRSHQFIGGGGDEVWRPYLAWLKSHGLESKVAMHHTSAPGLLAAVRGGAGMAVLPCYVADQDEQLVRCLDRSPEDRGWLWLMTHERLRNTPTVRTVIDFLAHRLTRLARTSAPDRLDPWLN